MHIVARVADDRLALAVAEQVVGRTRLVGAQQELVRIVRVVHIWRACRSCPIKGVEVEPRSSKVADAPQARVMLQQASIRGEIVSDHVAEHCVAGYDSWVIGLWIVDGYIDCRASFAKCEQLLFVTVQTRQIGEKATVLLANTGRKVVLELKVEDAAVTGHGRPRLDVSVCDSSLNVTRLRVCPSAQPSAVAAAPRA
jgi:hypothetical protein